MQSKNILNNLYSYVGLILFLFFFVILFRDFLYTYRIQLEKFLPYYPYQDQIMYYLTGDKSYDVEAPMNLRFLGLLVQFVIYKIFPCIELNHLKLGEYAYENYVCVTYSSAMMNYLSLCGILSLTFVYCNRKLDLNIGESFFTVFLTYIYLNHVEAFTLDRISILYFLFILYFLNNKVLTLFLIMFAALVNEKIIFILGGVFFIRLFFEQKKNFKLYFFVTLCSAILAVIIFVYYALILKNGYHQGDHVGGLYDTFFTKGLSRILLMFTNKSGLSNGVMPLILAILPYSLAYFVKTENKFYSKFDFLVPLSMVVFTAGGGMEQTGRYVMYTMPIWLPIFSRQIFTILKDTTKLNV